MMSADRPFEGELKERAEPPGVSIVIPAYNEESVIRQCLIAAIYQSVPAKEIIVVDNLSKDRTAKIVRRMQQEYPESPIILLKQADVQGLIPTRNYGLNSATGDIIGRIDADSVLEPDWVEQVQKAFADPTVQAATGPVVYYDMPMRRFGLKADDKMRQLMLRLAKHQYHFLFGSNMALRRGKPSGMRPAWMRRTKCMRTSTSHCTSPNTTSGSSTGPKWCPECQPAGLRTLPGIIATT
jgi:glycosyltransferase involved in cell wall biosynthesis